MLNDESVYAEEERRAIALSYLISNLFEAKSLDECLDVAIKGLSMLDFFQSQISLLEEGYFVVKRNHMDKKYQFLLEQMWGRKFLGHRIDARTPFVSHLLDSKIVTTADIKDAAKVKLEEFIREYVPIETGARKSLGVVTRVASVIPKRIDLLILPLNYRGKVIGAVGISDTSLEREDVLFLRNLCELFAQAFEKVQTREDLRKSEEELRSIFASSPDAITVSDLNGNIVNCNQATLVLHGYLSKEELIGKSAFQLIAKKDHKRAMENLKKTMEHGSARNIEYTFLTKDGREFPAELSASVIKDSSGNPTGFVAITKDITERKKAEEELIRLSSAVKMSTDGIVIADMDARITDANEAALKMYGTDNKWDLVGKNALDLIAPEDRERAFAGMKKTLEKEYGKGREYHIIIKDGSKILTEMSTAIMKDADGKPIGFVGIIRDITERKKTEEALRESEGKFRDIFENANDCMIYLDMSGRILDFNRKTVEVFGGSRKELLGKHFAKVGVLSSKDIPTLMSAFAKILAGKHSTLNLRIKNKKGQEVPLECSGSLMKTDGKLTVLVIARDVTQRKRAEEVLKESEEKYRTQFEEALDAIFLADAETGITIDCNRAASELVGREKSELVGKHQRILHPPEEIKGEFSRTFKQHLKEKEGQVLETQVITKKGEIKDIAIKANVFELRGKKLIQGIFRDITERKKAEEALRESEGKLNAMLQSFSDHMSMMDKDLNLLWANETAKKIFGDDIIGKKCYEVYHGRKKPCEPYPCLTLKTFQDGKVHEHDTHVIDKDGKIICFHCTANAALRDKEGKPTAVIEISRDITERKKAEEELRESESKSRTLLESLPQKIFFKNRNSVYISCNGNYARDLKIKSNEISGKTDYDFYPKKLAEKYRADDKRIMESGNTEDIEEEYIQDGQKVYVHTVKTPVKDENGNVVGILGIFWDITERKKAEEELIRLSSAVKMSNDSIVISDLDGKIIDVNEATLKMYGTDNKWDLIGKNSFDLIVPEEREKALEGMEGVLKKGYLENREYHIITKDGSRIPVDMSVAIMKDADGKPIGFVGISRDISERKRVEEALRESEERFRDLHESIQDPVGVFVGREGRLLDYNKAFKKLSGYTDEELKYKMFLDFVHPDDHALVLERYRTRYPEEKLPLVYEIRGLNKKGEAIPLEISVSTYKKKGKVIGIEVIHRDITERKEMEEKLRQYSEHLEELVQKRTEELLESEKRYSVLVEEASDGVVILQDGKIVFANKKAAPEIVGYSRNELIGMPFEKLVDEKHLKLVIERYERRMRREKVPQTYEIELIAETGERVPVELSAKLIDYQGRPADLIIVRDTTERKRMEEQRRKLEKLATIGELATMVGHDLRNPLQAIENATYYLNNELPSLPPTTPIPQKMMEMLQIISNSVSYADKIVRDLHDFSAAKKPILEKTDVNAIVKETLSQVKVPENVKFVTKLGNLPKTKVDKGMIKRVFMNLTVNGIQAMKKGGTLKVSTKKTKEFVEVSFKDTGIGMPKENMKKLFTPFFTTKAKGMGMGLPICKKLVESHGGSIDVESEEGKGTTFTVKLPIHQENGGENQ